MDLPVILGSSSKWRKQIVEKEFSKDVSIVIPGIDEKAIRHNDPRELTLSISRAKLESVILKIPHPGIVLCSDQVVLCNGVIREKPENEAQAREYLRSYRKYPAEVICAVIAYNSVTGKSSEGIETATQYFSPELPEEAIDELIAQGDVMHCSGGFVIELMEPYLGKLEGKADAIMGLPLDLTRRLIKEVSE